jgi:AraC-like DNA-binding protein
MPLPAGALFSFAIAGHIIFCRMRIKLTYPARHGGSVWFFREQGTQFPMHHHSELEVNLVVRGKAKYLFRDTMLDLRSGMQIWLFPSQDHVLVERSADYQMWIAIFRPGLVRRLCNSPATRPLRRQDPGHPICRQLDEPRLRQLLPLWRTVYTEALADEATFNAGLGWLLLASWAAHGAAGPQEDSASTTVHPAVQRAATLIRDEPEAMNLEALAERCGLSPSRLSRLFKQQTGVPLVSYRQRCCLSRFVTIYEQGQLNLLQAALRAGFGSYAQFHRVFREAHGVSPREWASPSLSRGG